MLETRRDHMDPKTQSAIRWIARITILAFICVAGLFVVSPFGISCGKVQGPSTETKWKPLWPRYEPTMSLAQEKRASSL